MKGREGPFWPAEDGAFVVAALRLGHNVTRPPSVSVGKHPQKEANLSAR